MAFSIKDTLNKISKIDLNNKTLIALKLEEILKEIEELKNVNKRR